MMRFLSKTISAVFGYEWMNCWRHPLKQHERLGALIWTGLVSGQRNYVSKWWTLRAYHLERLNPLSVTTRYSRYYTSVCRGKISLKIEELI